MCGRHFAFRCLGPNRARMPAHDDVIRWKHFSRFWPFVRGIHRSPMNSPHKGQWCGVLMFSVICAWIKGWVNNREAGDLRRHRAHYDVIVMPLDDGLAGVQRIPIWDPHLKCNFLQFAFLYIVEHCNLTHWSTDISSLRDFSLTNKSFPYSVRFHRHY